MHEIYTKTLDITGDIFEFGGKETFTPWYELSNNCDSNWSFVSGDASVGFSIIILYFITKNIYFAYFSIVFGLILLFSLLKFLSIFRLINSFVFGMSFNQYFTPELKIFFLKSK